MILARATFSIDAVNVDYMILLSFFMGVLIYNLLQGRRAHNYANVGTAVLSAGSFYLSRLALLDLTSGTHSKAWSSISLVLNFFGLFFATLFILQIIASVREAKNDRLEPDENLAKWDFSHLLRQIIIAGVTGVLVCSALAIVGALSFSSMHLVSFVMILAGVRCISICIPEIKRSRLAIGKNMMASFISIMLAWAVFHTLQVFAPRISVAMLPASRVVDILAMIVIVSSFYSSWLVDRLHCMRRVAASRKEAAGTREELDRLNRIAAQINEENKESVKKLREQFRLLTKKDENLEKTLQMALEIPKNRDLKELLQRIVELVRENLGFNTVVLRLLIEKTQSFESRAYAGVNEEMEDAVLNYRISKAEFNKMINPHYRISKSYFIRNSYCMSNGAEQSKILVQESDAWREIDMIIVPMLDDDEEIIGYLSVEDPSCLVVRVADIIEHLENIAALAVTAIKNARLFSELEEKNEKLRSYAEKLESLNKMKSNFVATISHEFKTPLTSIKAYCETLLNGTDTISRKIIKEFLLVINEESQRLMNLIEDILNFSKMESGALKVERSYCDLNMIVESVAVEVERNLKNKNINLSLHIPEHHIVVRADNDLIKQLTMNLLHNASKFTGQNGSVTVILEDETVSAKLMVEDNGIGIPEDQMEKIFNFFHQVDSSNTRKHGGTGMGLALCKNIVEWHDGKIWVENVEGGGARFTVILPKKQVVVRNQTTNSESAIRRIEIERYLELLIEMVAELLSVKRASIMLFDLTKSELKIESAIGIDKEVVENVRVKVGSAISGKVVAEGVTYLVEDIENDPRTVRRNNEYAYESKSFLSVPIKIDGEVVGVVNAANPLKKSTFDEEDKTLLEMFVERMAHAIQKLEEFTNVSQDFERIREVLKAILDAKRFLDIKSDIDISSLVRRTADKLNLNPEEKATLQYALNIYDVGLAKIGYHIIKKPYELTADEKDEVKNHTILGIEMLKTIEAMPKVKEIVLYHHENYNGSGYPGKLSGKAIPIGARIIRVADSFRALISQRPYQKRYSVEEAIKVLWHRSGTYFDPDVVKAFVEAVKEKRRTQVDGLKSDAAGEPGDTDKVKVKTASTKEEYNA